MWCAVRRRSEARRPGSAQGLTDEVGDGGREREAGGGLLGGGAQFAPSFFQNIDELLAGIVCVLGGEGGDFVFQKNEHGGVFEGLGAGVGFEAGFGNPGGGLGGFTGRYARFKQQGAGAFGLFHVE